MTVASSSLSRTSTSMRRMACPSGMERAGQGHGHVQGQAVPVLGGQLQTGLVAGQAALHPGHPDPAGGLLGLALVGGGVGAVRPVDRHPVAPGDKPTTGSPGTGVQHLANFTRQLPNPSTMMPESVCLDQAQLAGGPPGAVVPGTITLSAVVLEAAAAFSAWRRPSRSISSRTRATALTAVVPP